MHCSKLDLVCIVSSREGLADVGWRGWDVEMFRTRALGEMGDLRRR